MAIALKDYNYSDKKVEDFLDIVVQLRQGFEQAPYVDEKILKVHKCSEAELSFDESSDSKFYPINEKDK